MATVEREPASRVDQGLAEALQGWHRAREAAARHNRNLVQYGAMIAGALGVETGSGGIFSIASAVGSLPWWWPIHFAGTSVILATVAVVGVVLALRAYRLRNEAETDVEKYAVQLIALRPDRFLPNADSLLGAQT